MDFRIIKLKSGGYVPQVLSNESWKGIDKRGFLHVCLGMQEYEIWYGMEYSVKMCKVSSEDRAESVINGYAEWIRKDDSYVIKHITKPGE